MAEGLTIKESQLLMLENIKEVKEDISDIKSQFKELNGSVKETIIKLSKAEALAAHAKLKADEAGIAAVENPKENRRYIDRLFITALGSLMTALAAIIVVIIEIVIKT